MLRDVPNSPLDFDIPLEKRSTPTVLQRETVALEEELAPVVAPIPEVIEPAIIEPEVSEMVAGGQEDLISQSAVVSELTPVVAASIPELLERVPFAEAPPAEVRHEWNPFVNLADALGRAAKKDIDAVRQSTHKERMEFIIDALGTGLIGAATYGFLEIGKFGFPQEALATGILSAYYATMVGLPLFEAEIYEKAKKFERQHRDISQLISDLSGEYSLVRTSKRFIWQVRNVSNSVVKGMVLGFVTHFLGRAGVELVNSLPQWSQPVKDIAHRSSDFLKETAPSAQASGGIDQVTQQASGGIDQVTRLDSATGSIAHEISTMGANVAETFKSISSVWQHELEYVSSLSIDGNRVVHVNAATNALKNLAFALNEGQNISSLGLNNSVELLNRTDAEQVVRAVEAIASKNREALNSLNLSEKIVQLLREISIEGRHASLVEVQTIADAFPGK